MLVIAFLLELWLQIETRAGTRLERGAAQLDLIWHVLIDAIGLLLERDRLRRIGGSGARRACGLDATDSNSKRVGRWMHVVVGGDTVPETNPPLSHPEAQV